MSGKDLENELRDFFVRAETPDPPGRLRNAVKADRMTRAPRIGGPHLALRPQWLVELAGLAATVALAAGFLFVSLGRPGGFSGSTESPTPGSSALATDSSSPVGTLSTSPSATSTETASSRAARPSYSPPGKFVALSPTTPSFMWAAVLPDGRVLLAGGGFFSPSAFLFDPVTGTTTPTNAPSKNYFREQSIGLANGRVLFVGKFDQDDTGPWGEVYDPATGKFTPTGAMDGYRYDFAVAALNDGRALVVGGCQGDGKFVGLDTAEIYDPVTNQFTPTGKMSTPRCMATAVTLGDGRVLVAGGLRGWTTTADAWLSTAEVFDPATGRFSSTGSMHESRGAAGTSTLLQDGRVLMTGGDDSQMGTQYADLYDPTTGVFTKTGPEAIDRVSHTATLLHDGRVLIAGGFGPSDMSASRDLSELVAMTDSRYLSSAELYDPVAGTFTLIGDMTIPRLGQQAVLLHDGRVLMVGGSSDGSDSHLEVYVP